MDFEVKVTKGYEVVSAPIRPGVKFRETGRWWIDMNKLEQMISSSISETSFGDSISRFIFGFEIADFSKWGDTYDATKHYVSHRPKIKAIVSVGQFSWPKVKALTPEAQLIELRKELLESIQRVGNMKRKPKNFDYSSFADLINSKLETMDLVSVT